MANRPQPQFEVVKTFTGGLLAGITITELTPVRFAVGFECHQPLGGSPYRIDSIKEVVPNAQ